MTWKNILIFMLLCGLTGAVRAQTITAVDPGTAPQGTTGMTVTFTLSGMMLPPTEAMPESVTIGSVSGTSVAHPASDTVTAVFDFPFTVSTGMKDAIVSFTDPMGRSDVYSMTGGFTITAGADTPPSITEQPSSVTVYDGYTASFSIEAYGSDPLTYQWQKNLADLVDATNGVYSLPEAALADEGGYRCIVANAFGSETSSVATLTINTNAYPTAGGFAMVDTMQTNCYSDAAIITAPEPGAAFAGQDAQYTGNAASYTISGDGLTVYDNHTGLTWTKSSDTDGDGIIDADDKLTYDELFTYVDSLNANAYGGFTDWRVPSIKETYSLMDFRGVDPSGYEEEDTSGLIPFIDSSVFDFAYGDTDAGERIIDSQYGGTSLYVDGEALLFGVNFADGRIKGYGLVLNGSAKTFCVLVCRGNVEFGVNDFEQISTNVVVDHATGLMWQQSDSLVGLSWEDALAYAEGLELDGYRDWRLPTAKELQGLVDYTRSPGTSDSAAIDPVFSCTGITNENNEADFPWYWSGTTHANWINAGWGAYIAFGRAMGYDSTAGWTDVHGAGCQRSDPKGDDLSNADMYAYVASSDGEGGGYYQLSAPQGDAVRVYNHVRCVRGSAASPDTDTDGDGLTDWYEYNYTGDTVAMGAEDDDDGDGISNEYEEAAGTIPTDADSVFLVTGLSDTNITWTSELDRSYTLQFATRLTNEFQSVESGIASTAPTNTYLFESDVDTVFFRVIVE
ncbi:DUF1566 domain-containing protein [Pontiellaceae bacterium B12227]|nr:DUF1566 domain-containing protein [Pontiellaceae bacterium B12227]